MIRLYADVIGKNVGQRVVVDNRAGAGGIVAASALTQAQPDGYTLLLALGGMHTIVPAMQRLPFDPIKDFDFITLLYASSGLLLVPAANPAKSFSDFVADLKSKSGGAAYGTPGIGSPAHLMSAMLADRLAIPMTHIPYKGGARSLSTSSPAGWISHSSHQFRPSCMCRKGRCARSPWAVPSAWIGCPTCQPSPIWALLTWRFNPGSGSRLRKIRRPA
jgi:hypothetical protein